MRDSLKNNIKKRIKRRKGSVFMIDDFMRLSTDKNQIQRALRQLVDEGVVVRVGKGVYVRARISSINGRIVPDTGLRDIAIAVIRKGGGKVKLTPEQLAYNENRSTQVPNMDFVGADKPISRKLTLNGREIKYVMVK